MYKYAKIGYEAYRSYKAKGRDPDMVMPKWEDLSKTVKDEYNSVALAIISAIKTGSE